MINFNITVSYDQAATNTPGTITFQGETKAAVGRLTGIGTSATHADEFMIVDTASLGGDTCGPFTVLIVCRQVTANTMDIELTFTYRPDLGGNLYIAECMSYTSLTPGGTSVQTISNVAF